jgi:hypothetical protein
VADQADLSDEKNPPTRFRPPLAVAVAAVALVAVAGGVGLAASSANPILRTFSVSPSSIRSSGGAIRIKVTASHANSCVIASSPGIKGLPKAVSCKSGVASFSLQVPSNKYAFTRRFHLAARAVHVRVSSAATYRWLTQAAMPRVLTCTGHPVIKPRFYVLACGDGNAYWQHVSWMSWGAKTARGTGQLIVNDCIPYCFDGHFRTYPLTVVLSHLTVTRGHGLLYSQAAVSYSVKGKHQGYTVPLTT